MDSQLGETVLNLLWHLAQEYLNWKTYETQHYTFEFFLILPLISKRFIRERNATTPEKWAISFSSSGVAFIRLALAGRKFHAESVWKKGDGRFANGILGVKVSRPVIMILDNHTDPYMRRRNIPIEKSFELDFPYLINTSDSFHVIFRDEVNNYANPRDENSPVISVKWCFLSVDYPNFLFSDREGDLRKNLKEELTKKIPQVD